MAWHTAKSHKIRKVEILVIQTLIYAINKDFSIPDDILCIAEDAIYGVLLL